MKNIALYTISVTVDLNDDNYVARCPRLGLQAEGSTPGTAVQDLGAMIDLLTLMRATEISNMECQG